jgi:hypothetical protein
VDAGGEDFDLHGRVVRGAWWIREGGQFGCLAPGGDNCGAHFDVGSIFVVANRGLK